MLNPIAAIVSWVNPPIRKAIPPEFRAKTAQRLIAESDVYHDGVTSFLLGEAKELLARTEAGLSSIEAKATTQISTATAIIGLIAIFGPLKDGSPPTALLYCSVGLLVASICCNFMTLQPTWFQVPALEEYNDTDTLCHPHLRPIIQAEVTEGFFRAMRLLEVPAVRKTRSFRVATAFLILGIVFLFANYAASVSRRSENKVTLTCTYLSQSKVECISTGSVQEQ
jgi:hypothetical protein